MSIDIAGNPWTFAEDGSGTDPVGFSYFGYVNIRDALVTKVLNVGDRIYFTDFAGRQVFDYTAQAATEDFRIGRLGWVNGLKCVQFDSGELTIAV